MLYWAPNEVRTDRIVEDEPEIAAGLREHPDNYQRVERPVDDPHVAPRVTQRPEIEIGVIVDLETHPQGSFTPNGRPTTGNNELVGATFCVRFAGVETVK